MTVPSFKPSLKILQQSSIALTWMLFMRNEKRESFLKYYILLLFLISSKLFPLFVMLSSGFLMKTMSVSLFWRHDSAWQIQGKLFLHSKKMRGPVTMYNAFVKADAFVLLQKVHKVDTKFAQMVVKTWRSPLRQHRSMVYTNLVCHSEEMIWSETKNSLFAINLKQLHNFCILAERKHCWWAQN